MQEKATLLLQNNVDAIVLLLVLQQLLHTVQEGTNILYISGVKGSTHSIFKLHHIYTCTNTRTHTQPQSLATNACTLFELRDKTDCLPPL